MAIDSEDSENEDLVKADTKAALIGTEGMLVNYSKCCRPVPGDDIVAYVSQGKGLTVHRHECKNIRGWENEPAKFFIVKWEDAPEKEYIAAFRVELINHQGSMAKLTNLISSTSANIVEITTEVNMSITVKDRIHVANVMRKIRVVPEVQKVYRKK